MALYKSALFYFLRHTSTNLGVMHREKSEMVNNFHISLHFASHLCLVSYSISDFGNGRHQMLACLRQTTELNMIMKRLTEI